MNKLLLFAGTTEGRMLAEFLEEHRGFPAMYAWRQSTGSSSWTSMLPIIGSMREGWIRKRWKR